MKKICFLLSICFLFTTFSAVAQISEYGSLDRRWLDIADCPENYVLVNGQIWTINLVSSTKKMESKFTYLGQGVRIAYGSTRSYRKNAKTLQPTSSTRKQHFWVTSRSLGTHYGDCQGYHQSCKVYIEGIGVVQSSDYITIMDDSPGNEYLCRGQGFIQSIGGREMDYEEGGKKTLFFWRKK